jgi:hypothetical protein
MSAFCASFTAGFGSAVLAAALPESAAFTAGLLCSVLFACVATAEPADAFIVDTSYPSRCAIARPASTTTGESHREMRAAPTDRLVWNESDGV